MIAALPVRLFRPVFLAFGQQCFLCCDEMTGTGLAFGSHDLLGFCEAYAIGPLCLVVIFEFGGFVSFDDGEEMGVH